MDEVATEYYCLANKITEDSIDLVKNENGKLAIFISVVIKATKEEKVSESKS